MKKNLFAILILLGFGFVNYSLAVINITNNTGETIQLSYEIAAGTITLPNRNEASPTWSIRNEVPVFTSPTWSIRMDILNNANYSFNPAKDHVGISLFLPTEQHNHFIRRDDQISGYLINNNSYVVTKIIGPNYTYFNFATQ